MSIVAVEHVVQFLSLAIVVSCATWQYQSLARIRRASAKILADHAFTMTFTDPLASTSAHTNVQISCDSSLLSNVSLQNIANAYANLGVQNTQGNGMGLAHGLLAAGFMHDAPQVGVELTLEKSESTDVIVAWRAWTWTDVGSRIILKSLNAKTLWPWAEPAQADRLTAEANVINGIHAFKTELQAKSHQQNTCWGEVSLWGRVIEHEGGYRAEFAYPRTIVVAKDTPNALDVAQRLAKSYGIEARVEA